MRPSEREALTEAGFRALVLRTRFLQLPPDAIEDLSRCLGPLVHQEEGLLLLSIEAEGGPCEPHSGAGVKGTRR